MAGPALAYISLFGGLQVRRSDLQLVDFQTIKHGQVFAILAFRADRPSRRLELAEIVWPNAVRLDGANRDPAREGLNGALTQFRREMGPDIVINGIQKDTIVLNFSQTRVDTSLFTARRSSAAGTPDAAVKAGLLLDAIGLYAGELLPGPNFSFDDLISGRTRLHEEFLATQFELARLYAQSGMYAEALSWAHRLVDAAENTAVGEDACFLCMRVYARTGRYSHALQMYERWEAYLRQEMRQPSRTLQALAVLIHAGRPDSEITWPYGSSRRADLPTQVPDSLSVLMGAETADPGQSASGARQDLFHVPYERPPTFVGRTAYLERLSRTLKKSARSSAPATFVLNGMAGIGKTWTALEYCYRNRGRYSWVLWATADCQETLSVDLYRLAEVLGLLPEPDEERLRAAFLNWQRTHTGWLLVLDNVEDFGPAREHIAGGGDGHILLTSRGVQTGRRPHETLLPLTPDEGAQLLLRRASYPVEADGRAADEQVQDLAEAISHELGGLPLALDQAGALIESGTITLAGFLNEYRLRGAELLHCYPELAGNEHLSVFTTFQMVHQRLMTTDRSGIPDAPERARTKRAALDLCSACAFLAPDDIPDFLLREGAPMLGRLLGEDPDTGLLGRARAEATRLSLLGYDHQSGAVHMHRVVQVVVLYLIDQRQRRLWSTRVVRALVRAFPEPQISQNWADCARLLAHALRGAALIDREFRNKEAAGTLLANIGIYLHQQGRFAEAIPFLEQALPLQEAAYGDDLPLVAATLGFLGNACLMLGRQTEARRSLLRAYWAQRKLFGRKHPYTAASLLDLAKLDIARDRYDKAEPRLRLARKLLEGTEDPDHATLRAKVLKSFAQLHMIEARHAEAEPMLLEALGIEEASSEQENSNVAATLNLLGSLHADLAEYETGPDKSTHIAPARDYYQRAIVLSERLLGSEHYSLLTKMNNLAVLAILEDDFTGAELLLRDILERRARSGHADDPFLATLLCNLGIACREQEQYEEAEALFLHALAITKQRFGPRHSRVATNLLCLAVQYGYQERNAEARRLFRRALKIQEDIYGPDHLLIAATLDSYVECCQGTVADRLRARAAAIRARQP